MSSGAVEIEHLYRALDARVGTVIRTNDPTRLRARLYGAKKLNPQFEGLAIKLSHTNPANELCIVKKQPQVESPV